MTKIKFDIPQTVNTKLIVYDIVGREVATLLSDKLNPGNHEVDFDSLDLPEGTYFYKLILDGYSETKKMLVIK